MRNITPMNTPMIEKALLSFCARMVWKARRTASKKGMRHPMQSRLFVPQRFHRIELRRPGGRVDAEQDAGDGGCRKREDHGAERDVGADRRGGGDQEGD